MVEALRSAAKEPVPVDAETQAVRAELAAFHRELGEAMGWLTYDVAMLVREVGLEMARLRKDNARLAAALDDAQRRRVG